MPYVPSPQEMPPSWAGFFDGHHPAKAAAGHQTAQALVARFTTAPGPDEPDRHEVLITHDYPIAWLVRHAFDAPPVRWLGLSSANAALTVIHCRPAQPPTLVMLNDTGHLPAPLRWTGFPPGPRP